MFGRSKDHKQIQVLLYEVGSQTPFAHSELPIDQLPDTFEIDTTLHLGDQDWMVNDARPATKSEFRKSGRVDIYLSRPTTMTLPTEQILFSLPTIENALPPLVDVASLENVLVVHEDDWRQIELVSSELADVVETEMAAIEEIYQEHGTESGFRKLHVRKLIPSPMPSSSLALAEIEERLGVSHRYAGVAFRSTAAVVEQGFAIKTSNDWTLWGTLAPEGTISTLCIAGIDASAYPDSLDPLRDILVEHEILFVDWVRLVSFGRQATGG